MENYQEKARENFYRNRPYGIHIDYARKGLDRKSTRLNSSHMSESRMPSSA